MAKQVHLQPLGVRPTKPDILERLCQREVYANIAALIRIRDDPNPMIEIKDRLKAIEMMLDRGFGRPATTSIIQSGPVQDQHAVIDGQLAEARGQVATIEEIMTWASRNVPPDYWPDHVRKAAGLEIGDAEFGAETAETPAIIKS